MALLSRLLADFFPRPPTVALDPHHRIINRLAQKEARLKALLLALAAGAIDVLAAALMRWQWSRSRRHPAQHHYLVHSLLLRA